jgi:hypothetical protein
MLYLNHPTLVQANLPEYLRQKIDEKNGGCSSEIRRVNLDQPRRQQRPLKTDQSRRYKVGR